MPASHFLSKDTVLCLVKYFHIGSTNSELKFLINLGWGLGEIESKSPSGNIIADRRALPH